MSNFHRGGRQVARGFRGHGDHQNSGPNARGPNPVNRNNGLFNRNAPSNRMNPWEGGVAPGAGNNIGNHNMGNHNMGNHNMGNHNMANHNVGNHTMGNPNLGSHNMGNPNMVNANMANANIGCNRPSGGLLPTPNMPAAGLLPQPTIQDVQLAVASNVLNLLLPNMQSQQQNQMPSLLGMNAGRGLLPLSPPPIGPFQNQNFGGQRLQGPPGSRQDNLGPNRARPQVLARRSEPYNKMGNRNQRPGQKNDDHKAAINSPRSVARGPGASPIVVSQQARNIKEEKADGRKNQKTDCNASNDKADKVGEEKSKNDSEKRNENDKAKASYADIPSDMFMCHVCSKNMWDAVSYVNHIKGKAHQTMMERREESYKISTDMMRHEMKVEEQQRQIANEKKQRQGKSVACQPQEYCTMCNLHFTGHLAAHRKTSRHQQLKSFLHPKCDVCRKEFATRLDWDQHLLTAGHLKMASTKRPQLTENDNKQKLEKEKEEKLVEEEHEKETSHDPIKQKTESDRADKAKENEVQTETVGKNPATECVTLSSKAAPQLEAKKDEIIILPSPSVLNQEKLQEYDAQKEIGMEMLQEKTGYLCRCCNRFLSSSADAKTHCRSQFHYDKYKAFLNTQAASPGKSPKTNEKEKSQPIQEEMKEEKSQEVLEPEEEEEDEEDEGNWKRRKVAKEDDTIILKNISEENSEQVTNVSVCKDHENDNPASVLEDSTNLSVKQEEQGACEDLEKTLLLEEQPPLSTPLRGRGVSTGSRGRKRK